MGKILLMAMVVLVSLGIIFGSLIYFRDYVGAPQAVNATEPNQKTYHLGDVIYAHGTQTYYYHGIDSDYNLVIGHSTWEGGDQAGFSNIYIALMVSNNPQTFYLEDKQFEIVSYEKTNGATLTLLEK